jgi:hypothetical protein
MRRAGSGDLEAAMALLIRNEAAATAEIAQIRREEQERRRREDKLFAEILALLAEHSRLLAALPEAIREKIGYRPAQP